MLGVLPVRAEGRLSRNDLVEEVVTGVTHARARRSCGRGLRGGGRDNCRTCGGSQSCGNNREVHYKRKTVRELNKIVTKGWSRTQIMENHDELILHQRQQQGQWHKIVSLFLRLQAISRRLTCYCHWHHKHGSKQAMYWWKDHLPIYRRLFEASQLLERGKLCSDEAHASSRRIFDSKTYWT